MIFTRNATEGINLVAQCLGFVKGDEIVSSVMEHHSNIVPWQMLKDRGVITKFVDISDNGTLKMDDYQKLVTKKTKLVTVTHASNVLGTINDVKKNSENRARQWRSFVVGCRAKRAAYAGGCQRHRRGFPCIFRPQDAWPDWHRMPLREARPSGRNAAFHGRRRHDKGRQS